MSRKKIAKRRAKASIAPARLVPDRTQSGQTMGRKKTTIRSSSRKSGAPTFV